MYKKLKENLHPNHDVTVREGSALSVGNACFYCLKPLILHFVAIYRSCCQVHLLCKTWM